MRPMLSALLLALFAISSRAAEVKFPLTGDNTLIQFVGTKPDGKHEGGFKTVKGTATVSGVDVSTLKLALEIDMDSTYTDDPKLTAHLKSPDFFDVKANPKSKFATTKVERTGEGYTITGDLTLNGKTRSLTFPAKLFLLDGTLLLEAEFRINRNDFGISYGKGKIDDQVTLKVSLKAKK